MAGIGFVDAHMHLWRLDRLRYPWLTPPFDADGPNGSVASIARDYGVGDYRAATADWNVRGAVHVEAGAAASQALDETRWLEEQGDAHGLPDAIVAHARLDAPGLGAALAAQARHPRVRGVRQILNWHPDPVRSYTAVDLTRDDRWHAGFARLAAVGLSFDLQCYPAQVPALAPLFERQPGVPVIVNHLGMPVLTDPDGLAVWRRGLRLLAAVPHVAIKLSGLGFVDRRWTDAQVRPLLAEVVDLFGTRRCLFATDAPTDVLFSPLERYLATYRAFAAAFSPDEQRDMWGRNAARIYRLALDL